MRSPTWVVCLLPLVVACGDGSGTELGTCLEEPVSVACGASVDGVFVPLAGGDPVPLARGPAGGWTLRLAASVGNAGEFASVRASVTAPSFGDALIGEAAPSYVALSASPEPCTGESPTVVAYVDTFQIISGFDAALDVICALEGEPLRVEIEAEELTPGEPYTPTGRSGTCSVDVVAALDPADVEPCAELAARSSA